MTTRVPSTDRLAWALRLLHDGVRCPECQETLLPRGLAAHRRVRHGIPGQGRRSRS